MKIQSIHTLPFEIPLSTGQMRKGILLKIIDGADNIGWGEVAPLPKWSVETLESALLQQKNKQQQILKVDWNEQNCFAEIGKLNLLPSLSFGLESALLSILSPTPVLKIETSALLMGTKDEILHLAAQRREEGYLSAKLKVSNLNVDEATFLIRELKDQFRLRIDVNRAWDTGRSLKFFEQFHEDTFDYVEEPFQDPHDLKFFPHPLAVDESYPHDLSLAEMASLPTLKAIVYKPTIQGGISCCLDLCKWAKESEIDFVLSSSFESDIGLAHVATMAHRLCLTTPVGIGTYHYLNKYFSNPQLQFSGPFIQIPDRQFVSM